MIISKYWRRRGDHTCASCCAAPPGVRQCGQPCTCNSLCMCWTPPCCLAVHATMLLNWEPMDWTMCSAGIHVWWYSVCCTLPNDPANCNSLSWPVMTPLTVLWCLGTPPVVSGKLHQNLWVSPSYNVLLHIMRSHSRSQQQQKTNRHFLPFKSKRKY